MNYGASFLCFAFLLCVILAGIVNIIYGFDVVYSHLFYIPIILTGILYPRYAVFLAIALGLLHITCNYFIIQAFKIGPIIRAAMFLTVAYMASYITLKRDSLFSKLQVLNGIMINMINHIDSAKSRLQRSEEKARLILDASPSGIVMLDRNGTVLDCNKTFLKRFGVTREKLLGTIIWDRLPPSMRSRRQREVIDVFDTGNMFFGKDQRQGAWYEYRVAPAIRVKNKIEAVVVQALDITDQVHAETKLKQSNERHRSLIRDVLDTSEVGIFILNADLEIIWLNRALERFFCLRRNSVIGQNIRLLIRNEIKDVLEDPEYFMEKALATYDDNTYKEEFECHVLSGENRKEFWLKHWSHPIKSGLFTGGRVEYYYDITERKRFEDQLYNALGTTVKAIGTVVEARNPYTSGHQKRVASLARAIAKEMNLSENQIEGLGMAGSMHDIGKVAIPTEILNKPGLLTEIEYNLIKNHPQAGFDVLKDVTFPLPIARMILEHHERIDGSGYPNGLTGDEILLESKILAVADVLESMASHRPYRPALGLEKALEEIENQKGKLYDADVVDACLRLFKENGFQLEGLIIL